MGIYTRAPRLVRPGSRPGRGRPNLAAMAGGGGGGGFALKGTALYEGTNTWANSLALPGSPAEGDLAVIIIEGAGGITDHFLEVDPGDWTSITTRPSTGRILHKILGDGETTGPADCGPQSADGHAYIAVFSGATFTEGRWCTQQENTDGLLTGSTSTQRVVNTVSTATADQFVMVECGGSSGSAEFAGTVTFDGTPISGGELVFDGREVTFGHAAAGAVVAGDDSTATWTFSGLDANFNFTSSTSARRGGYAIISAA